MKKIRPCTGTATNFHALDKRIIDGGDLSGDKAAIGINAADLMDLDLPVIDGWEVTRRLKQDVATRDIPIIALTAHAMAGSREKAIAAGCDEFDTKPINFDRLMQKIDRLVASSCSRE